MYEVTCTCGRELRGQRQRGYQVVPCPNCGRTHFILPRVAWSGLDPPKPEGSTWRPWRAPLLAGVVCLALVLVGFLLFLPWLQRPGPPQVEPKPESAAEAILARMKAGRHALAEGEFQKARRILDEAVAERDRLPQSLPPGQHRELNQLQRQADLLARLSLLSLEEILRRAALMRDPEERKAQFDFYHRGRTVVFDDLVGTDVRGRPVPRTYEVRVQGEVARLALEELNLFQGRLLEPPQRLLFGARLAGCELEEGGTWAVHFEPSSGVLLTDGGAAAALLPGRGEELTEVLKFQRAWVDRLAGLRPAPP